MRYFSESEPLKTLKKSPEDFELELHKDGGRYVITGFNKSEDQGVDLDNGVLSHPISDPEKWKGSRGVWCSESTSDEHPEENYETYYLGIYIFHNTVSTLTKNAGQQKIWKNMLAKLIKNDFTIKEPYELSVEENKLAGVPAGMKLTVAEWSDEEKELLAIAVKENIIKKDGDKYIPKFTVFTREQIKKLRTEIFEPLVQLIKPQTLKLVGTFQELNEKRVPRKIQGYIKKWTYFDIWDSGIKNFMFAADDGYLYMPETPEDGACLTLSFIY